MNSTPVTNMIHEVKKIVTALLLKMEGGALPETEWCTWSPNGLMGEPDVLITVEPVKTNLATIYSWRVQGAAGEWTGICDDPEVALGAAAMIVVAMVQSDTSL